MYKIEINDETLEFYKKVPGNKTISEKINDTPKAFRQARDHIKGLLESNRSLMDTVLQYKQIIEQITGKKVILDYTQI